MTTERFEFREELGRGGGGKVIRAFDRERGVDVALKRLHAASSAHEAALRQEHRLLQGVNHPCIVTPLELGRDSDGLFLVSAFVPGEDFVTHCKGSWLRLGTVVPQLLSVLRYLHSRGLAHGDISPNNVRVRPNGQVGVIDFGLAGRVDSSGPRGGTPGFVAPEREQGGPTTPQSDIFAVGVLLGACVPDETLAPILHTLRGPAGSRPDAAQLETMLLPRLGSITLPISREAPRISLVGRSLLLGRLRGSVLAGRSMVLEGPSAIGKTTLLDALVDSLREMTVLRARPRPGSRVPFEALDQLLASVPSPLSIDAAVGARLGRHSPVVANWIGQSSHALRTRAELQSRLFGQTDEPTIAEDLRGVLQQLERLVLVVDDLQWADSDSVECLEALAHDHVIVAAARPGTNTLRIPVTPVPPLRRDAMHALLTTQGVSEAAAVGIAESSAGVPGVALFAARFADGPRALHAAVASRIAAFQDAERAVLANVIVAGGPLASEPLSTAALEILVREGFVVWRDELVDIAHDVLREPVAAALGEDWLRTARLQRATEPEIPMTARVDAYLALGEHGRASELAHVAAEEAMALGAFHAAAELWSTAAKTEPALRSRWGEACVAAGRHDEAALVWHQLVRESTGSERRKHQLARAHALLAGRRIDEGKAALQEALGRSEPTWKTAARFLSGPRRESPRLEAEGAELALRNAALVGYLDSLEGVRLALDARSGFGKGTEELGAWADSLLRRVHRSSFAPNMRIEVAKFCRRS